MRLKERVATLAPERAASLRRGWAWGFTATWRNWRMRAKWFVVAWSTCMAAIRDASGFMLSDREERSSSRLP